MTATNTNLPPTKTVDIVISDGFPMLSLTLITEPLRVANRESGRRVFRWRVLSPGSGVVRSSSGLEIRVDGDLDEMPIDALVLLASYQPDRMVTERLTAWLRRRAASGAIMGCVDTGALVFAEAGLLRRRPATVHHEAIAGFREAYGYHLFVDRLYDMSDRRCSSAGGVVTADMTLALIERFSSSRLARRVAEILNYRPVASERARGTFGSDWSIPRLNPGLARGVEIMLANLEQPLSVGKIAEHLALEEWQLRRLFHRYLGMSPRAYYLDLRLDQARNLLRNSRESVATIAFMCGFTAAESLSRAYKRRYGVSPSSDRSL